MGVWLIIWYIPTGMKVKSAILFSMVRTILSCPLWRNVPELVRTLRRRCFRWRMNLDTMCMYEKLPAVFTLASFTINNSWFYHMRCSKFNQILTFPFRLQKKSSVWWVICTKQKEIYDEDEKGKYMRRSGKPDRGDYVEMRLSIWSNIHPYLITRWIWKKSPTIEFYETHEEIMVDVSSWLPRQNFGPLIFSLPHVSTAHHHQTQTEKHHEIRPKLQRKTNFCPP